MANDVVPYLQFTARNKRICVFGDPVLLPSPPTSQGCPPIPTVPATGTGARVPPLGGLRGEDVRARLVSPRLEGHRQVSWHERGHQDFEVRARERTSIDKRFDFHDILQMTRSKGSSQCTSRLQRDFLPEYYELHRRDAVAMERLTPSPYVMDIFGHCGQSSLTEIAFDERGISNLYRLAVGLRGVDTSYVLNSKLQIAAMTSLAVGECDCSCPAQKRQTP